MSRSSALALLCLASFLILLPLSLKKPGLPMRLYGDEATYLSMAASLAADGDLICDHRDLDRLFAEFPFAEERLELDSDDGWADGWAGSRFARPLIYPLLAAPFVALWGANGAITLNAGLFVLALAVAWLRLRRLSSDGVALLFGIGFFLFSTAFVYLFRVQPQIMVMAAVTIAMVLGWSGSGSGPRVCPGNRRWWFSGAALGVAILQQAALVVLAVPLLAGLSRQRWRAGLSWLAGCAVTLALGTLLSIALTGRAWPDHLRRGAATAEYSFDNPQVAGLRTSSPEPGRLEANDAGQAAGHSEATEYTEAEYTEAEYTEATGTRRSAMHLIEDACFFLWGRRTGILPYFPLILPIFVAFAAGSRRCRQDWLLLATLASLGVLQVIFEPTARALHEAQVGNAHMVGVYPALLLLIKRLRGWVIVAAFGLGPLVLGPLISSSLGVVVPGAGLHFHTRNAPLSLLPFEYPALSRASGFSRVELYGLGDALSHRPGDYSAASLSAPSDQAEARGDELWLLGGESVELWLWSRSLLPSAVFSLRNLAPGNRISMRMAGEKSERLFEDVPEQGIVFRLELNPRGAHKTRRDDQGPIYYYRLRIETRLGEKPKWRQGIATDDYLGIAIAFLGTREFLERDLYATEWLACGVPPRVVPEEQFLAVARLRNLSEHSWPNRGPARVRLSYRWLSAGGEEIPHASVRTELPSAIEPGQEIASWLSIDAPGAPGNYLLELDPLFENVAWFSTHTGTCRAEVVVGAEG